MTDGSPLVLLHPLGSDRSFWDEVVPLLPGTETCVLDLPGHGVTSNLPEGSGIGDVVDWLVDTVQVSGHSRFHVAGVSLGGLVAQELAARHPGMVDRLVLADTVATYPGPMRDMWRERAATARSNGLDELADPMEAMWFSERFRAADPRTVQRTRAVFLAMDPEGYARACDALAGADATAAVRAIQAPTLVVCGSEDAPPFTGAAAWLHDQIPGSGLTWLTGAKHAAVLEQPRQFATALRRFLG